MTPDAQNEGQHSGTHSTETRGRRRMRAKPDCEAQNAGIGTPTAGSPECGHWHAHSAKPRMRALRRPNAGPPPRLHCSGKLRKRTSAPLHHLRRALRDGTTSQSLRIGVKKINSTVLLEEPLKTPENLQKQLLDTNFAVCSYSVVLVPAAPNTFQIARNRIAALLMPLAMLHETKCRQLN